MKVEQKFILSIKEATFELTKEEAQDLYFSLQSALDKMPIVNIPFQNPIRDNKFWTYPDTTTPQTPLVYPYVTCNQDMIIQDVFRCDQDLQNSVK